ncbi:hypothetical protein [Streptomyces sp. NPDC088350]|uniref:nSTAND1 domain-containing NTPase n=1 Tax=Streptomyces sp. NPDC088350 TaxID=3365854 RepID=UPI00382B21CF
MTRRRGRPERPLDPDEGPVQRFAHELRSLRREADSPSYREMAERARLSVAALSRAASGERLPSVTVVRAYAQVCGADPDVWEKRLGAAADEAKAGAGEDGESPYQGLARFEHGDRNLFFGRDRLAEDAVRMVLEHRFVVVFGASGSGKSSLLRAGLMPRLETVVDETGCDARLRMITPGARPAATHGRLLLPRPEGPERLVVVDQFEEVFTLCRDRADRWRFVDQLLAARDPAHRLRVVITVGRNFAHRCAEHPGLAEALRTTALTVGPMTRTELREAVVGPATAAGLRVERELTQRIVEEVAGRPGALPMLSQALRETWRRRRSGVLTLAAYEEAGGVHGAIARAAEEVYGRLTPDQAGTAQRLLLALIAPGEGGPDTRRPVRRAELREWQDPEVPVVLERLARARLVTLDEENAELAHEALITGWPRLQCWIEGNRDRLRVHRHLSEAARSWQEHGRDAGSLYRGVRLAVADVLFVRGRDDDDLTGLERAFLSASRVAHRMERWSAHRARGRVRALLLALSLVTAGALLTGEVAWDAVRSADLERTRAAARHAAALAGAAMATDPRTAALLGVAAWRLAPLPESRAALLGALADPERDVFTAPQQGDGIRDFLTASGRTLLAVGAGRWTTWDVTTHRRTGGGRLPGLRGVSGTSGVSNAAGASGTSDTSGPPDVSATPLVAVAPDGRTLALADDGGRRLWRLRAGAGEFSGPRAVAGQVVGFGADGGSYVVHGPDSTTRLRAVADDRLLFETATADAVVPGAGARLAAVCAPGRPLTLWDTVRHRVLPGGWQSTPVTECSSSALAFDGDGTRLAAVAATGIRVWDTASGRQLADIARPADRHLAFTADGTFLAAVGPDDVTVWRLSSPAAPVFRRLPADGPVTALAWDPAYPTLRYLAGGTVHSLDLSVPLTTPWSDRAPAGLLLSPDGRLLATAERYGGGYRFRLSDTRTGRRVMDPPLPSVPVGRQGTGASAEQRSGRPLMAFSPDGRAFAYGIGAPPSQPSSPPLLSPRPRSARSPRFVVWDVPGNRPLASLDPVGPAGSEVRSLALTPGGRELLLSRVTPAGSLDGEVWDTVRRTGSDRPRALARAARAALVGGYRGPADDLPYGVTVPFDQGDGPYAVALSRDGRYLATGGGFGGVTLWRGRGIRTLAAVIPPAPGSAADCTACSRVTALAFSPDGRTLAVGYGSGALRLWDVDARQSLGGSLGTPGDAILSLAFAADGGSVYAGGAHVPVQRYAVDPSAVVTRLCARAGRTLTAAEWRTYLPGVPYLRVCGP